MKSWKQWHISANIERIEIFGKLYSSRAHGGSAGGEGREPGRPGRRGGEEEEEEEEEEERGCRPAVHQGAGKGCAVLRALRPSPSSSGLPRSRPRGPQPGQQGEPGHSLPTDSSAISACPPGASPGYRGLCPLHPQTEEPIVGNGLQGRPVPARLASREAPTQTTRGPLGAQRRVGGVGWAPHLGWGTRAKGATKTRT